jgi:integrase
MASFRKHGAGWRAEVYKKGVRKAQTFPTKAEAKAWAHALEGELAEGLRPSSLTVGKMMERYAKDVSPSKKGAKWEQLRIAAFQAMPLAQVRLSEVDQTHISAWRDERLKTVKPGTLLREWTLLSHGFQIAVKEWLYLSQNPMTGVRRPLEPAPRTRILSGIEQETLAYAFGANYETATGRVGAALVLALETGMRAGELCGLTWDKVDLVTCVADLPKTKNGDARQVPLSQKAVELLKQLPKQDSNSSCLRLNVQQMDSLWRKIRDKAGILDCHFHDSRATAVTNLAKKLNILDLARMIGHRDLRSLQIYYRESAEDIAKKL